MREDRFLIHEVDRWLYEEIEPYLGRRILEIGCGLGNFARHLADRELYVGIDTSAESIAHVQRVFAGHPNMQAHVADVTNEDFLRFAKLGIDTVFSLNVFEHIEDHMTALRHVAAVLRPQGLFVLVVPAHNWLYGSIDRAIGHYRRYDKPMTARLFEEAGLSCVKLKYLNTLGALGWFVNGRIRKQKTPPPGQLRLFNKIVSTIKRFERAVTVPFGISLLAVGKKE